MLDINLFREEKGGNPELIRESQRRRYKDVSLVDSVIELDQEWRKKRFDVDQISKEFNKLNKSIATKRKAKEDAELDLMKQAGHGGDDDHLAELGLNAEDGHDEGDSDSDDEAMVDI